MLLKYYLSMTRSMLISFIIAFITLLIEVKNLRRTQKHIKNEVNKINLLTTG